MKTSMPYSSVLSSSAASHKCFNKVSKKVSDAGGVASAAAGLFDAFNLRRILFLAIVTAGATLASPSVNAANLYWDINGATAGAGGTSPSGTWDTAANWTTDPTGASATTTWVSDSVAIFSAGTDATGAYTSSLSGTQSASGVLFSNGTATVSGGTLTLTGSGGPILVAATKGMIASAISGTSGVTKSGAGELVLSGANTFTGSLTNRSGTLTLDNNQAGGGGAIVINPLLATSLHSSQDGTIITNKVLLLGTTSSAEIDADAGKILVLSGAISGSHSWSVNGAGTLVLSNDNAFSGTLTMQQGTLVAASAQALGLTSSHNQATVNSGATLALEGGIDLSGNAGGLALNGSIGAGGGPVLNNISGNNILDASLTLNTSTTIGATADSLSLNQPIAGGSFAITNVGAGEVDLTGNNNVYGNTVINQGYFGVLVPANTGSGTVTVNSGGTFLGNGTAGAVIVNGTIMPDANSAAFSDPDTLDTGSETWNGGGSYVWLITDAQNSGGWSGLNITGSLAINATSGSPFVIDIDSLGSPAANFSNTTEYTWTIATASGGISGFDASKFTISSSGFANSLGSGAFILQQSGNSLILRFVQKPQIAVGPASQTIPRYGNVTFSVTATGTATLHYQWYDQNNLPVGTDSASYAKNNLAFADGGTYTVVVTNLSGTSVSATATLTVIKATPTVTSTGGTFVYNALPETGSGIATGGAGEPLSVTFSYNGTGSTVYGPTSTAPKNVGTYTVTASTPGDANNFSGSSSPAALTITPASLTLTPTTNVKIYDATTSATNVPTATGLKGSDTVSGTTEVYDNQNVGTGKTLSITAYTVNDGFSGGNYTVTPQTSTGGEIDKASLTLTPTTNVKIYDATTSATNVPTATGLKGSDTVSGTTEVYD
ncbi:MAG TPA: YDG domain-containing protein, partial [Candidatus Acidoferrales bacterium]|nr:YDG domain-containing protein [Candidatus Acidoferrales bacterium]